MPRPCPLDRQVPRSLVLALALMAGVAAPASALNGQVAWTLQFGTPGTDHAAAIAATPDALYVAGTVGGSLDGQPHAGADDAYIKRLAHDGSPAWTRQLGTAAGTRGTGVWANASGVLLAGYTSGALPGASAHAGTDAYAAWTHADGTPGWTHQFGASSADQALAASGGPAGGVVGGFTYGAFPGHASAGDGDIFVRALDGAGAERWTTQFGSTGFEAAYALSVADGTTYVAGLTTGTLPGQVANASHDAYVARLGADGTVLWLHQFGTAGADQAFGIAADATGATVTGLTTGAFPGHTAAGGIDTFVARLSTDGDLLWTQQFGTPADDRTTAIAGHADGWVVAGVTAGTLDPEGSAGGADAFRAALDADGAPIWTHQFGTPATEIAFAVAAHGEQLFGAGSTTGTFDGQASAGGRDAFVAGLIEVPDGDGGGDDEPAFIDLQASLAVEANASPGRNTTIHAQVANAGNAPASGLTLILTVDPALDLWPLGPAAGACEVVNGTATCSWPALEANTTLALAFNATAAGPGEHSLTWSVAATQEEGAPGDESATATLAVVPPGGGPPPDVPGRDPPTGPPEDRPPEEPPRGPPADRGPPEGRGRKA